jgi:hypothetical protein
MNDFDKQSILATFRERRLRQIGLTGIVLVVLFSMGGLARLFPSKDAGIILVGGVVLVIAVLMAFNWRCPGCNKMLGKNLNPRFCEGCGVQLME